MLCSPLQPLKFRYIESILQKTALSKPLISYNSTTIWIDIYLDDMFWVSH
jgi:hypothetical protein